MADYNPIEERAKLSSLRGKGFNPLEFAELKDPIPAQINDPEEIRKTWGAFPYIPYAGTASTPTDAFQSLLKLLATNSPTLSACLTSIKRYAFSGKFKVIKYNGEFVTDVEESSLISNYLDFISSVDVVSDDVKSPIKGLVKNCYDNLMSSGDTYLLCEQAEVGGVITNKLTRLEPEHCKYAVTDISEPKILGHSLSWEYSYLVTHPPKHYRTYPYYNEEDGVKRSVIHIKEGNFMWYGRPRWIGCFLSSFNEYQNVLYRIKEARNDFKLRAIVETEYADDENGGNGFTDDAGAIQDGWESAGDRIEGSFSMRDGNPQYIVAIERAYQSGAMKVHEFKPNQNAPSMKVISALNEKDIIRNCEWSQKLLDSMGASGLMGNVFMEDIASKEMSVLPDVRDANLCGVNTAFSLFAEWQGISELQSLGLGIISKFNEISDAFTKPDNTERGDIIQSSGE